MTILIKRNPLLYWDLNLWFWNIARDYNLSDKIVYLQAICHSINFYDFCFDVLFFCWKKFQLNYTNFFNMNFFIETIDYILIWDENFVKYCSRSISGDEITLNPRKHFLLNSCMLEVCWEQSNQTILWMLRYI